VDEGLLFVPEKVGKFDIKSLMKVIYSVENDPRLHSLQQGSNHY
jgi:hypothetical protein